LIVGEVSPPEGTTISVLVVVTVIVVVSVDGLIMIGSEAVGLAGVFCVTKLVTIFSVSENDLVN
jgi:hypothetical protein